MFPDLFVSVFVEDAVMYDPRSDISASTIVIVLDAVFIVLFVKVSVDDVVNVKSDVRANVPVPPGIVCVFTVPKLVMLFELASKLPPNCGVVSSDIFESPPDVLIVANVLPV
jgi:hypothetical protein